MSEHIIAIGAYGWLHPQWDEDFYPDDLPFEWKIGYYGNEYPLAVVPHTYWTEHANEVGQWLEDCDESLEFIAEWPPSGAAAPVNEQAAAGIAALGKRVIAILFPITAMPSEYEWDIFKKYANEYVLSFDVSPDLNAGFKAEWAQRSSDIEAGFCWHGDPTDADELYAGKIGICRVGELLEPRALRVLFEKMIAVDKQTNHNKPLVFIADGSPPSLQLLTNAGIILDLL